MRIVFAAVWAQAEPRKVLRTIGAVLIESEVPVAAAYETFAVDGRLRQAGSPRRKLVPVPSP